MELLYCSVKITSGCKSTVRYVTVCMYYVCMYVCMYVCANVSIPVCIHAMICGLIPILKYVSSAVVLTQITTELWCSSEQIFNIIMLY